MIEFFVPGKPRQRGSKTAIPIRLKDGSFKTVPTKNGKKRLVMRYVDAAVGSGAWKDLITASASLCAPEKLWDCPITLVITFLYKRPGNHYSKRTGGLLPSAPPHKATTPDLDKLCRTIFDALNKIVYFDDGRIVDLRAMKSWSKHHEGVLIRAWDSAVEYEFDTDVDLIVEKQDAKKPF